MKRSIVMIFAGLLCAAYLAGCGASTDSAPKDKEDKVAEIEDNKEDLLKKKKKNKADTKDNSSDQRSLAQRMAGKYSYHYSDDEGNDEYFIMDVVPFGDNLYAFCGQAMPDDNESLEAYTFWASEFIPYEEDEMTSTDGDKVTVNELRFSVMSNAGKYWDSGCKGTITLTDDGLVFEGFTDDGFLSGNDDSRSFIKDDRVEDVFSNLKGDKTGSDEELQGLWVHKDKHADMYIEVSGSDMILYRKEPDREVFYAAGECDLHDGSLEFTGNCIESGGMPFEFSAEYKAEGDTLTLEAEEPDATDVLQGFTKFERSSDAKVHVITMDDIQLDVASFGPFVDSINIEVLNRQDYYGVFVSSAKEQDKCTPTIDKLEEAGFIRSFTVYTPDMSGLNPEPYYVVTTGLYTSEDEAQKVLSEVKAAGFKDAYVKYAGTYMGDRYWYTMHGGENIDMLKDGVMLRGVSVSIPYPADGEPVNADLLVTEDTVFDRSADLASFGNSEKGDTPYEWIVRNQKLMNDDPDQYQMNGPALSGVFEVGIKEGRITTYYGSYWFD